MSTERERFVAYLAEHEDDHTARGAFADWLDEHDEPEEADRMRKWPAAKAWLVEFASGHWSGYDHDDPVTYEQVVEAGRGYLTATGYQWGGFTQFGSDSLRDATDDDATRAKFWECVSVVTGLPVPADKRDESPFSCSC